MKASMDPTSIGILATSEVDSMTVVDSAQDGLPSSPSAEFRDRLTEEIPHLRAFAVSLSGSRQLADDLVQDTLLKAWGNSESFQAGTNLRAWLFTILRNTYYSLYRRRGREVQDSDGLHAARLSVDGGQEGTVDLADFRAALSQLPEEQRDVLIMVGASGLSYEETAQICNVAVGTVKSRVSRARNKLAEILGISGAHELSSSRHTDAVVKQGGAPVRNI